MPAWPFWPAISPSKMRGWVTGCRKTRVLSSPPAWGRRQTRWTCKPRTWPLTDLALSPILFSNSVQNAAAAYISMLLKIRGPSLSINQYEMAVPLAFQTAIDWLEEGRTETVLVGSIDCFSKALHEASLSCRDLKNGDGAKGRFRSAKAAHFSCSPGGGARHPVPLCPACPDGRGAPTRCGTGPEHTDPA